MTDFHLCTEGQRLWDEWDKERKIADDCLTDEKAAIVTTANEKWVAYLDHRAACKECTKLTRHKKQL
jgi:hypothetical protein